MSFEEKKYIAKNGLNVTYIEDPYPVENAFGESKLVVIFQSLGDEKSEDPVKRYPYTLLAGLRYHNCRKLYIKDDKEHVGDYYIGSKGEFKTQEAVLEFIKSKVRDYKILTSNITFFGFSKGGYAALLFSHLMPVNAVISAIPQYDLVKWIEKYKPHLSYIYPENATEEQKKVYSNHLGKIIKESIFSPKRIYLITSRNDDTYSHHIPPLLTCLNDKGESNVNVFYNDECFVTQHNNVVKNSLNEILAFLSFEISSPSVQKMLNRIFS